MAHTIYETTSNVLFHTAQGSLADHLAGVLIGRGKVGLIPINRLRGFSPDIALTD